MWSAARPRWIVYSLTAEAVAVFVIAYGVVEALDNGRDIVWFGILLAMGLTQGETWRQIERVRRWMSGYTHINVTSVWCLAGALLLSPGWVALLAAALYAHLWLRVWRHVRTRPLHRVVASAAWAVLSSWAAALTLDVTGLGGLENTPPATRGAAVVLLAALVFELVNLVSVAISVVLYTERRSLVDLVGTRGDNALELVTLCLGGLTATALAHQPVLAALTCPPLLLLHRQVLINHLAVMVATDHKTGLINNTSWHHLAHRELERAKLTSTTLAIFMIDVDHFKKINDTHGHLVGDHVLKAVATTITNAVRDTDFVGRFGGEEFVVLLPGIDAADVGVVAERVRGAVASLTVTTSEGTLVTGVSVSIGTATFPGAGTELDQLIHAADTALLNAKRTGRNRVAHGAPPLARR